MPTELDKFFNSFTGTDAEVNEKLPEVSATKNPVKEDEDTGENSLKNRRERRMAEKLQAERDSAIALNERVKYLAEENARLKSVKQDDIDPDEALIYGTDENGQRLKKFFNKRLSEAEERGAQRAIDEFDARQNNIASEQHKHESFIDEQLISLEETHNVDLTSNSPIAVKNRTEFLGLIEKISPKDKNGSISEYADFGSTFEIFKGMKTKPEPNRAKELAARSMQSSTSSGSDTAPEGPMTFSRARQQINKMFSN